MDWRVNQDSEPSQHRWGKGWRFSYWGESSEGKEIANSAAEASLSSSCYPLSQAKAGSQVWLVGFQGQGGINRLLGMGLTPGAQLQIVSSQPSGSVLLAIQDNRLGLGAGMAHKILVSDQPLTEKPAQNMATDTRTYLQEMPVGTVGCVVGYDHVRRGYKGKLLSMGLTPGTEFTVIRVAPLGDPVEILVRGFHLSLRKQEADALVVEEVEHSVEFR